jgi:hypothetical protein
VTDAELSLLRAAVRSPDNAVAVHVTGCAYSCCGRGWLRRDGYEQVYYGWVDNLHEPEPVRRLAGSFMLYSPGLGTLSYVIAARFDEVALVEAAM